MKHFTETFVPATTRKQQTNITCDICKKDSRLDKTWHKDFSDITNTNISIEEGYSWPEGGSRTRTEWDICPDCFKSKIIPFLDSIGAESTVTEHDY